MVGNIGVAPIYENWMMLIRILDEEENIVYEEEKDISLNKLLPGEHKIDILFPKLNLPAGAYHIEIGFIDPLTGKPGIALANIPGGDDGELYYRVMEFLIDEKK